MYENVATVNVALNLVLIPRYSYLGAAVVITLSYLLMNVLYFSQHYWTVGIHLFRGMFVRTAVAAGVAAGVALARRHPRRRVRAVLCHLQISKASALESSPQGEADTHFYKQKIVLKV
ncbi:hypothetical protein [Haladaptatus sp. NG-WS-4]